MQPRVEALLHFTRKILRQGSGGAQDEVDRRQIHFGGDQGSQVYGGGDQNPWTRDAGERAADVCRIERTLCAQSRASLQGKQDRRLESVHVLGRDRADQAVRAAVQETEAIRAIAHASHQPSPGLLVRNWSSRRARREHIGSEVFARDLGSGPMVRPRRLGVGNSGQIDVAAQIVGETERIRGKYGELPDCLRRTR